MALNAMGASSAFHEGLLVRATREKRRSDSRIEEDPVLGYEKARNGMGGQLIEE